MHEKQWCTVMSSHSSNIMSETRPIFFSNHHISFSGLQGPTTSVGCSFLPSVAPASGNLFLGLWFEQSGSATVGDRVTLMKPVPEWWGLAIHRLPLLRCSSCWLLESGSRHVTNFEIIQLHMYTSNCSIIYLLGDCVNGPGSPGASPPPPPHPHKKFWNLGLNGALWCSWLIFVTAWFNCTAAHPPTHTQVDKPAKHRYPTRIPSCKTHLHSTKTRTLLSDV